MLVKIGENELIAKCMLGLSGLAIWIFSAISQANTITIAAASDLKFAMDDLITEFKIQHPAADIKIIYGSSGKLRTQIEYGAPFDMYFSADISYPQYLYDKGLASSEVIPYAIGRLVLWSDTMDVKLLPLSALRDQPFARIAIANPKHAPYGIRAKQVLETSLLWSDVQSKLIYADSISHAAQYIKTQHAQVGLIALSLVVSEPLANKYGYQLIPEELHDPLIQGFMVTKYGAENTLATTFTQFMLSDKATQMLKQYGFTHPNK